MKLRFSVNCILYRRKGPDITQVLNLGYTYQIPSKCIISAKIESLMSRIMRNPVYVICEQQTRRSACASAQSDQRLCCSLPR